MEPLAPSPHTLPAGFPELDSLAPSQGHMHTPVVGSPGEPHVPLHSSMKGVETIKKPSRSLQDLQDGGCLSQRIIPHNTALPGSSCATSDKISSPPRTAKPPRTLPVMSCYQEQENDGKSFSDDSPLCRVGNILNNNE